MPRKNPKTVRRRTKRRLGRKAYGKLSKPLFHKSDRRDIQIGREYEVLIIDTTKKGQGIGYINGRRVLVRGAEPGEKVRVIVRKVLPDYAVADPT